MRSAADVGETAEGFMHSMPFGAEPLGTAASEGVRFRLWAPGLEAVAIELMAADAVTVVEQWPLHRQDDGWHERVLAHAHVGTHYRYRINDDLAVPDPASRFNPLDAAGPSEVTDPRAYRWRTPAWAGLPWHTAVIYELHLGTFTRQGRLDAAAERLPELKALGINTVELMPVADFPGTRSWGYDGVLPFAPDAAYGTPDDLKRFVDRAHELGMMVLLDVVYNHFGPQGNHLPAYCPEFFNPAHQTPWGAAVNFDGAESRWVRRFYVDNALYWVEEFRFDGLRLDATHAIRDDSAPHIVAEIAAALRDGPGRQRQVHLVVENDANSAAWLARDAAQQPTLAHAQWNDDLHHAAHVLASGEVDGYYRDYAEQPVALLAHALAEGFVYQGQPSAYRDGAGRGERSAALPSQAFVSFLQTHDQVGNRAFGERLDALAPRPRVDALLACLLLSPHVPMLFMGEEFAATTPFLYFCDFSGALAHAVSAGRKKEMAAFLAFRDPDAATRIADPNALSTFEASTLNWSEREQPSGQQRLALVERLLGLRAQYLVPLLPQQRHGGSAQVDGDVLTVAWQFGGQRWTIRANFGAQPQPLLPGDGEQAIYHSHAAQAPAGETGRPAQLAPNGVFVSSTVAADDAAHRPASDV